MSASETGDGDLYDADVHDFVAADLAPGELSDEVGPVDDAVAADGIRASEVDDTTSPTSRPSDVIVGEDGQIVDPERDDLDLEVLLSERHEFKDIAQRVQAEYDNFRRQAQIRAQADIDRATGRLAEALLPVLDAAEAAYLNHPTEVGPLLNQMLVELKKQGLEAMDLDGSPFDPELAEAVAHDADAGGEPVVVEVLRSGYKWKGKTLRAAMVRTRD